MSRKYRQDTPKRVTVSIRPDGGYIAHDQKNEEIPGLGMFLYHTQQRFKFGQIKGVLRNPEKHHGQKNPSEETLEFFHTGPGNCPNWELTVADGAKVPDINYTRNQILRLAVAGKWQIIDQIYTYLKAQGDNDKLRFLTQAEITFDRPEEAKDRQPFYDGQSYIREDLASLRRECGINDELPKLKKMPTIKEFMGLGKIADIVQILKFLEEYPYKEIWHHIQHKLMPQLIRENPGDCGNDKARQLIQLFLFCQRQNQEAKTSNAEQKNWRKKIQDLIEENEKAVETAHPGKEANHFKCWKGRLFQILFIQAGSIQDIDKNRWSIQHLRPLKAWVFTAKRAFHGFGINPENPEPAKKREWHHWDEHSFRTGNLSWASETAELTEDFLPIEEIRKILNSAEKAGVCKMILPAPDRKGYNQGIPADIFDNNPYRGEPICTHRGAAAALFRDAIRNAFRDDDPIEILSTAWAWQLFDISTYPGILRSIELGLAKKDISTKTKQELENLRANIIEQLV
jgi:hypothetical protein